MGPISGSAKKRPAAAGTVVPVKKRPCAESRNSESSVKEEAKATEAQTVEGYAKYRNMLPPCPSTFDDDLRTWRAAVVHLDIKVPHSIRVDEKWKSLEVSDLKVCYERRREHMRGEVVMADWYNQLPPEVQRSMLEAEVGEAIFFWFCKRGRPCRLPKTARDGLESAYKNAQFKRIRVLTYQDDLPLPGFCERVDANNFMTRATFEERLETDHYVLPQLSDTIRHMAAEASDELVVNVVDMDTIFIGKALPPKRKYGHGAATFLRNPSGFDNLNMALKRINRMAEYCQHPRDNLKIATPLRYIRQRMF